MFENLIRKNYDIIIDLKKVSSEDTTEEYTSSEPQESNIQRKRCIVSKIEKMHKLRIYWFKQRYAPWIIRESGPIQIAFIIVIGTLLSAMVLSKQSFSFDMYAKVVGIGVCWLLYYRLGSLLFSAETKESIRTAIDTDIAIDDVITNRIDVYGSRDKAINSILKEVLMP